MKAKTGKIEDDNIVQEQEKLTKIAIYHSRLQTWVPQSKYREPLRNRKKKMIFEQCLLYLWNVFFLVIPFWLY